MTRPRIGLALGSGSARGWSHIGIIEALVEAKVEPDIVCGTSIGALVGAAYVAGKLEKLRKWAEAVTWRQLLALIDVGLSGGGLIGGKPVVKALRSLGVAGPIEDFAQALRGRCHRSGHRPRGLVPVRPDPRCRARLDRHARHLQPGPPPRPVAARRRRWSIRFPCRSAGRLAPTSSSRSTSPAISSATGRRGRVRSPRCIRRSIPSRDSFAQHAGPSAGGPRRTDSRRSPRA